MFREKKILRLLCLAGALLDVAGVHAIEVHGHRGARARFPENTLPAFDHAIEVGVDALELDITVTKDDQLLVSHDLALDPLICQGPKQSTLTAPVVIREHTLAELQTYDCGSLPNVRFPAQRAVPGTRMPSLDELIAHVKASPFPAAARVKFNIETKLDADHPDWTPTPVRLAELLAASVRHHGLEARVIVQSFDYRTLAEMRRMLPQVKLSALTNTWLGNSGDIARLTGAEMISPLWQLVNPAYVRRLHARNIGVVPWTANRPREWAKLLRADVDAIITDDPDGLIRYLKERGLRP